MLHGYESGRGRRGDQAGRRLDQPRSGQSVLHLRRYPRVHGRAGHCTRRECAARGLAADGRGVRHRAGRRGEGSRFRPRRGGQGDHGLLRHRRQGARRGRERRLRPRDGPAEPAGCDRAGGRDACAQARGACMGGPRRPLLQGRQAGRGDGDGHAARRRRVGVGGGRRLGARWREHGHRLAYGQARVLLLAARRQGERDLRGGEGRGPRKRPWRGHAHAPSARCKRHGGRSQALAFRRGPCQRRLHGSVFHLP